MIVHSLFSSIDLFRLGIRESQANARHTIEAIKRGEACEICGDPFDPESSEPYAMRFGSVVVYYCYQCYGDAQEVKRLPKD